jgi:hypothetical protein
MKKQKQSDKLKIAYNEKQEKLNSKKEKVIGELSDILKKIETNLNEKDEQIYKPKQDNK